jgi:hypothetical protein
VYLGLDDPGIKAVVREKYGVSRTSGNTIMMGIRRRNDFAHMTKLNDACYQSAMDSIVEYKKKYQTFQKFHLILLSDTPDKFPVLNLPECIDKITMICAEDDIVQLYTGLCCRHMILSESTFHYWIAVLRTSLSLDTSVIVFADTDITNRNLHLDNWSILPLVR